MKKKRVPAKAGWDLQFFFSFKSNLKELSMAIVYVNLLEKQVKSPQDLSALVEAEDFSDLQEKSFYKEMLASSVWKDIKYQSKNLSELRIKSIDFSFEKKIRPFLFKFHEAIEKLDASFDLTIRKIINIWELFRKCEEKQLSEYPEKLEKLVKYLGKNFKQNANHFDELSYDAFLIFRYLSDFSKKKVGFFRMFQETYKRKKTVAKFGAEVMASIKTSMVIFQQMCLALRNECKSHSVPHIFFRKSALKEEAVGKIQDSLLNIMVLAAFCQKFSCSLQSVQNQVAITIKTSNLFTRLQLDIQSIQQEDAEGKISAAIRVKEDFEVLIQTICLANEKIEKEEKKVNRDLILKHEEQANSEKEKKSVEIKISEFKSKIANLESEKKGLIKQKEELQSSIKNLNEQIENAEKKRTYAWMDTLIPLFAMIDGIIKGEPERMIPGYSAVHGIISACGQDLENAERRLANKKKESKVLLNNLAGARESLRESSGDLMQKTSRKREIERSIARIDQEIKIIGKDLTNLKQINKSLKEMASSYLLLEKGMDVKIRLANKGLLKDEKITTLLNQVQEVEKTFTINFGADSKMSRVQHLLLKNEYLLPSRSESCFARRCFGVVVE